MQQLERCRLENHVKLTVGTRGSNLSLIQTDIVVKKLKKEISDLEIEVKVIKTTGDRITSKPLLLIKEKGIFEKDIDKAVLRGDVDFAVHSMKDVPTVQPPKTIIVAVPERESPHDVLISRDGMKLKDLPSKAVVGTGSPRRKAQLHYARPDLKVESIRGNVDTRLRKLKQGLYDAVILAEAGLQRLNIQDVITERLPIEEFTPASGQGALAVVAREDNEEVNEVLRRINHWPSMAAVLAERAFVRKIGGGCKVPLGAIAQAKSGTLSLYVSVLSPDGKTKIQTSKTGDLAYPEELGLKVAQETLTLGAESLIRHWRELYEKG
ncbi:hydroxymethylbilane synthase [Candidatus Bathyarchaeota archaeon]|nr:MAG: hydroxymethylbilane synthase [Candidatus Bathyarchaeota archaeon]